MVDYRINNNGCNKNSKTGTLVILQKSACNSVVINTMDTFSLQFGYLSYYASGGVQN